MRGDFKMKGVLRELGNLMYRLITAPWALTGLGSGILLLMAFIDMTKGQVVIPPLINIRM